MGPFCLGCSPNGTSHCLHWDLLTPVPDNRNFGEDFGCFCFLRVVVVGFLTEKIKGYIGKRESAQEDTEGRLILTCLPLPVWVIIKKINGFLQVWRCDEYLQS